MRVLFVSPYMSPYAVGGAEESTLVLARELRRRGTDVRLVVPRLGALPPGPEVDVPISVVPVGLPPATPGVALRALHFDRPEVQLRMAVALARIARPGDVVHVQNILLLPAAALAAKLRGLPLVASIRDIGAICSVGVCLLHGPRVPVDCSMRKLESTCVPEFMQLYGGRGLRTRVATGIGYVTARARAALLRRASAVVSVSGELAAIHADAGLIDSGRTHVLGNIAELPSRSVPAPDVPPYALYAGKVSLGKGMGVLLEAMQEARRQQPDIRLVVVGQADERWTAVLADAPGVEFLGRVARERLAGLYAGAKFAVVPSIWPEPLPRAALEAAFSERAVIGSTAGGVPEAIRDGETGILVPARDSGALGDAMVRLWRDEDEAASMGLAGRRHAQTRFSAEPVCRRFEALYEQVAA